METIEEIKNEFDSDKSITDKQLGSALVFDIISWITDHEFGDHEKAEKYDRYSWLMLRMGRP
jgi:hypothetical protein